jgi:hypothetical protein
LAVLCNVVGAATVYKIVKKDYIALQCKSMITKVIINRDRVDNKGTQSRMEQTKSGLYRKQSIQTSCGVGAHEVDYVAGLRRPIKPMESRTGGTV